MQVTIGADPELFFQDDMDQMVSIVGKLGGTKEVPLPIDGGCAVQEDNVAAEFNIPPATSLEEFRHHIRTALVYIDNKALSMGLKLAKHIASSSFPDKELESWQAQVFGCDPDLNSWTRTENPRPNCSDHNLRSAGGHIHIGCKDVDPFKLGQSADLHLGIPSLFLDEDVRRRQLYGGAGCIRIKPYGIEYRSLSNFWIWEDDFIAWAWTGTNKAVQFSLEGREIPKSIGKHIQKAMNNGDVNSRNICLDYLNQLY